jgi:transaldolase
MEPNKFLRWLSGSTRTAWWHDSAIPEEVDRAIADGAVGVTTNPVLVAASLTALPGYWRERLSGKIDGKPGEAGRTESILRAVTSDVATMLVPAFDRTKGDQGYVCAQVNPRYPGDAAVMSEMAERIHTWAPNIAIKLPATASGLDVLEECAALGYTVVSTVSFTLPQALCAAERYERGRARAVAAGIAPGRCIVVVMVGRIDDYLRDVAHDQRAEALESDIIQCGNAIMKRAWGIWQERGYQSTLMPAGMRGTYHATEVAGAGMTLSVHPKVQAQLARLGGPFEERIDVPIDEGVLDRLLKIREFRRAYEPDGLSPDEFITYGVVQKTLAQFIEAGWSAIEAFQC